jgi:putative tricarboxylic transport membrane protein
MKALDIATALIILALSVVVAVGTAHLPYWSDYAPGPAFASFWVAAVGGIIGLLLLATALRQAEHQAVAWPSGRGLRQVLLAAASLWLLLALLPWLGFVVSATLFMLSMLLLVQRRRVVPALAATALTVAVIEAIFGLWLAIDLPKGLLGF